MLRDGASHESVPPFGLLVSGRLCLSSLPLSSQHDDGRQLRAHARPYGFGAPELSREAAARPSRLSAREIARERVAAGFFLRATRPLRRSRSAFSRTSSPALPAAGGGSSTPARRALESPIAIACSGERAPCFRGSMAPLRLSSIYASLGPSR
jgi:hypothetical protein